MLPEERPLNSSTDAAKEKFVLRLYVTGASPNSSRAIANIKDICEIYLKNRYSLQIIDIYQQPQLAKKEQLVALPLLVKMAPLPQRRLIGDLANRDKVLQLLGLK